MKLIWLGKRKQIFVLVFLVQMNTINMLLIGISQIQPGLINLPITNEQGITNSLTYVDVGNCEVINLEI